MSSYTAPSLNPFQGSLVFNTLQVPKSPRCGLKLPQAVRLLLDYAQSVPVHALSKLGMTNVSDF